MTQNLKINHIEQMLGKKVRLKINDNRHTMLSVRWEPDQTKVSIHRMFLTAPQNVMDDLACYVRKKTPNPGPLVREYIEKNLPKFDYSHTLNHNQLHTRGHVFDLQKIYDDLNAEYFDSRIDLSITWFGSALKRSRSRVVFGLYHDPVKLIKIARFLDNPLYPDYLVQYVVYHEMLHNVCPSYYDERGLHKVHSKEFKEREKKFRHFALALEWIKKHQHALFEY